MPEAVKDRYLGMVGGTGEDPRPEMEFCPLTGPLSEEDRFDAQFTDSYSCKPEVIKRTAPVCYYVMNFAEFGEVFRLVELNERLSESLVRFLFKQLVDGLHYLHTRVGVVHRDIKPENLLIDKNFRLMIADFNFATRLTPAPPSSLFSEAAQEQ